MALHWADEIVVQPAGEPVSLAEIKLHARVDTAADDTLLTLLLTTARRSVEQLSGRAALTQSHRLSIARWPDGSAIWLPYVPVTAVQSISYTLEDGSVVVLAPQVYALAGGEMAHIELAMGQSWPSDSLAPGLPILVDYTAGAASSAWVPVEMRVAILMQAAQWYDDRSGAGAGPASVSGAVAALIGLIRVRYDGPDGGGV